MPNQYVTFTMTEEEQNKCIAMAHSGASYQQIADIFGVSDMVLFKYRERNPAFQGRLDVAREEAAHKYADSLMKIVTRENIHPGIQRNQMEAYKWLAAKRKPKVYGDRMDINVSASLDIRHVLDASEQRILPLLDHGSTPIVQLAEFTEHSLDATTGLEPVTTPNGKNISELV